MTVWRYVIGFDLQYEVSEDGRVRSILVNLRSGTCQRKRPVTLRQVTNDDGHKRVGLMKNGRQRMFYVHHLVLEAFVGPCPPGLEASHKDGDPSNNHVSNLVWESHLKNVRRKIDHGTVAKGINNGRAKLTWKKVSLIRYLAREKNLSQSSIARRFRVNKSTIAAIVSNRTWME